MPEQDNLSQYLDVTDLEVTEKNIYYSRPATVFAAVAASIFTIIGVLGESEFYDQGMGKESDLSDIILDFLLSVCVVAWWDNTAV